MTESTFVLQTQHVIVSCAFGLVIGGLIAWRFRFPRNWLGFVISLAVAMISPWIGVSSRLVDIRGQYVIYANFFLVSLFAVLAVAYIIRLLRRPDEQSARPKVTKYLSD